MIQIQFSPLKESDLSLLIGWFHLPHVEEYWTDRLTDDEVRKKYGEHICSKAVFPFLVSIDGKPIGYIQSYATDKAGGDWWTHEENGTFGLDLFIGEASLIGKGLGTVIIQSFLSYFEKYHSVKKWIADPDPKNRRGIKCFEKAGFKAQGIIGTPNGQALLMTINYCTKSFHLSELLTTEFADDEMRTLYSDIFGTLETNEIQNRIYKVISDRQGTVEECLFTEASIGAVFGFKITTGQNIVLKVYSKRFTRDNLDRIHIIQKRLHQFGYPAPALFGETIEIGPELYGVIMEYISGHRADGHDPLIGKELAHHLAELSKIIEKERLQKSKIPSNQSSSPVSGRYQSILFLPRARDRKKSS